MAVQRCGPSGMLFLSACFGMFDFGMFQHFLLSACCIPHTHMLPARCWSCSWSKGSAQLRCSNALQMLFLACKLSSCRSCRSVVVALAQLEVADDSSSTYTTTTQLQRVTQGKDAVIGSSSLASYIRQGAVIGSSIVALVVLAQRGKKRLEQRNCALVILAQRGKRPPKQTLQRIVLPPQILQFQLVTVNLDLLFTFVSCSYGGSKMRSFRHVSSFRVLRHV